MTAVSVGVIVTRAANQDPIPTPQLSSGIPQSGVRRAVPSGGGTRP